MDPTAVDLFAGCGGFSTGLMRAGFRVLAASELWEPAAATYARNHPGTDLIVGDIRATRGAVAQAGRGAAVVFGGPPCQGYSQTGLRDPLDPRGQLFNEFAAVLREVSPPFFVMENVKGLLSMRHAPEGISPEHQAAIDAAATALGRLKRLTISATRRDLAAAEAAEAAGLREAAPRHQAVLDHLLTPLPTKILATFAGLGYQTTYRVLNAADFGAPQCRERVLFFGSRVPGVAPSRLVPRPTHAEPRPAGGLGAFLGAQAAPWVTARDALADLEGAPESPELSHTFAAHTPEFLARIRAVAPGENVHKKFFSTYYRLPADRPARTVMENHGATFLHYRLDRTLTARELARLQGFPDDFLFCGTKGEVLKQVGNAVPVPLAAAVGRALARALAGVV